MLKFTVAKALRNNFYRSLHDVYWEDILGRSIRVYSVSEKYNRVILDTEIGEICVGEHEILHSFDFAKENVQEDY